MNTENKLPEEFKQKWVAALRSGEYKQCTTGVLTEEVDGRITYCCLAVGGCVAGTPLTELVYSYFENAIGDRNTRTLWLMNDGVGEWSGAPKSFSEIADYIEQNL